MSDWRWYQDLNGNGVPDWREPWLYRAAWAVVRALAAVLPSHTLFSRGVAAAEEFRANVARELPRS